MSNHINSEVIQRTVAGGSALQRLAYQTCTYYNNGKSHADYSRFAGDHRGGLVCRPMGADPEFADECNFVMAVAFRETRVNAQEGRAVDFALPRELPEELLLPVASFVMAAFVRQGMAVRIDIECPQASDNGRNLTRMHSWPCVFSNLTVSARKRANGTSNSETHPVATLGP